MADRPARLITKQTAVPGRIPTGTTGSETNFIKQGELAQNTVDKKLFGFDGSNVFEFGSESFLALTGGTIFGSINIVDNLSASTLYSGNTNLQSIFNALNSQIVTKSDLSGSTFTGGIITPSLSATTLSGATIYSGNTNLYSIFTPSGFSRLDLQVITSGDSSSLTTTSTTFVDVPGMSASSRDFGTSATTYVVEFNCNVSNSTNNAQVHIKLQKNGVDLSGTSRNVTMGATNQRLCMSTTGFATNVAYGDVFKAQWRVGSGTARMTGRTFSVLGTITNNTI